MVIVLVASEQIAEHFGKPSGSSCQDSDYQSQVRPLSVNVVYTGPDSTITALRAAELLVRSLGMTVHIRVMVAVPRQLAIELAFNSVDFLKRLLTDLIERNSSGHFEYVLHIYVCRDRVETLLKVLPPSSLLVIGGRRRLWPTAESRLSKAAISAGHSVAFVDPKAA